MLPRQALPERSVLTTAASLIAAVFALLAFAGAASAEEAPLRAVFVNSDPSDGDGVYDSLSAMLEASNDLELVDPGELLAAGDKRGISLETLRDGDQRIANAQNFRELLAEVDAESILVLDVFGGGRTMQLVVIGPYGNELGDIRQSIAASQPSQSESISALKQAFKALVPKVRQYREEKERLAKQQASVDLVGAEEKKDQSIKQRVIREHRQNHADLKTGITPHVGVIFGRRSMDLSTKADYQLDHASPFFGFGAEVDAIFALLDGETAAVGATLFGSYAPFTTVFTTEAGQPKELPSAFSNVGVDLKYIKGIGQDLIIFGKVGAEVMTVSIEQNQAYTGNSYTNLRAGAGIVYQFGQLAELHLDGAALPTLSAELSGDTMGDADFAVGWNGAARLHLTFLRPVEASVGYDFQYYPISYANPKLEELGGLPATTSDMFHLANVMIGYGF